MNRLSQLRLGRAITFAPLTIVGSFFLFTLSGCPGGAELEDPGKFGIAGAAVTGTGGAGTGSGGTGGGTTGGSAGTSSGGTLTVNCTGTTYDVALKSCNQLGCHAASYPYSGLNLTADSGLVSRLKDVPAKHGDVSCSPSDATQICTCDSTSFSCTTPPTSCPKGDFLVDSSDYTKSWLWKKLEMTDPMCGVQMPDGAYRSPADKACLEAMVQAIAMLSK
jgi:hypothetical protein